MGFVQAEIKPFKLDGTYQTDFANISSDVILSSVSSVSRSLDLTEFDIGVFRSSNISVKLDNSSGRYSGPETERTIFNLKRNDSQFRLKWRVNESQFGLANNKPIGDITTAKLAPDVIIFDGLLGDKSSKFDAKNEVINFQVFGFETLFSRVQVPFTLVSNGQAASDILLTILNQTLITDLLTVSSANINPDIDTVIDDVTDLKDLSVEDALKQLLLLSNSVLQIKDRTIFIDSRVQTSIAPVKTFYGQGSVNGGENIINVRNITSGQNRVLNQILVNDDIISQDTSSISLYGSRSYEIKSTLVTTLTSKVALAGKILSEFALPKQEFDLQTTLTYSSILLNPLDVVSVDFPPRNLRGFGTNQLPFYGQAVYGTDVYPDGQFSFVASTSDRFKIIETKVNPRKSEMSIRLRKV